MIIGRYIKLILLTIFCIPFGLAWYYTDWPFRLPIYIKDVSGNNIYNATLNITIDTASLIAKEKMSETCADIRFTYVNLTTGEEQPIPFWVNTTTCNTNSTIIWFKVPYIPANGEVTVYMYYGNLTAPSKSNFTATFNIFQGSYDTGRYYYNTGIKTIVDMGYTQKILKGNITVNVYDSDWDTYDVYIYCDGSEVYRVHERQHFVYDVTGLVCRQLQIRVYDTEQNDYVEAYGNYYIVGINNITYPLIIFGSEQASIKVYFNISLPKEEYYYNISNVPFKAKIILEGNVGPLYADVVQLVLNDSIVKVWYNVSNGTVLEGTIPVPSDGKWYIYFEAIKYLYNKTYIFTSDKTTFYVDTHPPNITVIKPESYIRLHYPQDVIPIYVNVTDNMKLKSCKVVLWNESEVPCNINLTVNTSEFVEGHYTIKFVAEDKAGNVNVLPYTFYVDLSKGTLTIVNVSYPKRIPATDFNITVYVTCDNDWCDSVKAYIKVPEKCVIRSQNPVFVGDVDKFETFSVYWTIKCTLADNYTFIVNVSSAAGARDNTTFVAYPPILHLWYEPAHPTENDDIILKVKPEGYGTYVTLYYRITRKRNNIYTTLKEGEITVPSDVVSTIYTIPKEELLAGDIILFYVKLLKPKDFIVEWYNQTTIEEYLPPVLISYSMKYYDVAPHDDVQTVKFVWQDNTIVSKVELYVDFGNGFVLYDKRENLNAQQVTVKFNITHNESLAGKTIKMFSRAYDEFGNFADSPIFEYEVVKDNPPQIELREPKANVYYNTSKILVTFRATDDFSKTISCKIITNTTVLDTITVNSGEWVSREYVLQEGSNTITVECQDAFGNTASKSVSFIVDTIPPTIEDISYKVARGAVVTFNIYIKDNIALSKIEEIVTINNETVRERTFKATGTEYNLTFDEDLAPFTGKIVHIKFIVYDKAGNSYVSQDMMFAVSKVTTPGAPPTVYVRVPPRIEVIYAPSKTNGTITIKFKVEDDDPKVHCFLDISNTKFDLGWVDTGKVIKIDIIPPKEGKLTYYIKCIDPHDLVGLEGPFEVEYYRTPKGITLPIIKPYTEIPKQPVLQVILMASLASIIMGILFRNPVMLGAGLIGIIGGIPVAYGIIYQDPLTIGIYSVLTVLSVILLRKLFLGTPY